MNEKKINVGLVLLHFFILLIFVALPISFLEDWVAPSWYANSVGLDSFEGLSAAESTLAMIIGLIIMIPIWVGVQFLFALWFKSIYNHIIPIIYNVRKIHYWEAFGLSVLIWLMVGF